MKDEAMVRAARVIGLGQACVDYLSRIPYFPEEDGKLEVMDLHVRCGGPASTALVALSRLGVPTSFLGSISDDPAGIEIVDNLKREGVDVSFLKITPGRTSQFAFIAISKTSGKRTIFWGRGSAPPIEPKEVRLDVYPSARVLHLDSLMIEASIEAARQAKALGMTVVMDAGTLRPGSERLAALVDVLIASQRFAADFAGAAADPEKALEALRELGPGQAIVTLGAEGSVGSDAGKVIRQSAFPVKAVDTTGAGDVYHGAYIYGVLKGWKMAECMRFASAAAALKCTKIGAQTGIPDLQAVRRLMDKGE